MRRNDRAMDRAFALEIIDEAAFGVLSLAKDGEPYGLPLSMVREGNRLLFHTALEGHKYDFIEDGARAHVVFISRVGVPDLYSTEELDELAASGKGAASLLSQVFTTEYASAMVRGEIRELRDPADKMRALELICLKYTGDKMKYFKEAAESGGPLVRIFEVSLDEVTGKRKAFDRDKKELKFGRRE